MVREPSSSTRMSCDVECSQMMSRPSRSYVMPLPLLDGRATSVTPSASL